MPEHFYDFAAATLLITAALAFSAWLGWRLAWFIARHSVSLAPDERKVLRQVARRRGGVARGGARKDRARKARGRI